MGFAIRGTVSNAPCGIVGDNKTRGLVQGRVNSAPQQQCHTPRKQHAVARLVAHARRQRGDGPRSGSLSDLQDLLGDQLPPTSSDDGGGAAAGQQQGQQQRGEKEFVAGVTWDPSILEDEDDEASSSGSSYSFSGDEGVWSVTGEDDDEDVDDVGGGQGQVVEDVEIYSLDSGWSLEALENVMRGVAGGGSSDEEGPEGAPQASWNLSGADSDDSEGGGAGRLMRMSAFASLPAHMVRQLEEASKEAAEANAALRPSEMRKAAARRKTHRRLTIISGTAAGRALLSPQGDQTRPMMEKVRGAVFSMIQAELGGISGLPQESRWLDLFAGTGAVGIEALSRGCGQAHFVELDSWVTDKCLKPNMVTCGVESRAVLHMGRAEDFLKRSAEASRFAGGAFDFVSVCPPYLLVSYDELFELLDASPLLHDNSIVILEYPKQLGHLIRDRMGLLYKIRDRKYGRTYIAIYGPETAMDDGLRDGW